MTDRIITFYDIRMWDNFPDFVEKVLEYIYEEKQYESLYPPYNNRQIEEFKRKYYYPLVKKYGSEHIILKEFKCLKNGCRKYCQPCYDILIKNLTYLYKIKVKYENTITKEYFDWINEVESKLVDMEWVKNDDGIINAINVNTVKIRLIDSTNTNFDDGSIIDEKKIRYRNRVIFSASDIYDDWTIYNFMKRDKFAFKCITLPISYIINNIFNSSKFKRFVVKTCENEIKTDCDDPYSKFINKIKKESENRDFISPIWYKNIWLTIRRNMAALTGLSITPIFDTDYEDYDSNCHFIVRIFKLTPIVKKFLVDLLKTYTRNNDLLNELTIDWNYDNVITRDEILELLKLFDDEKPKENIKVEEKFDSYKQILEDNKKLAQKCKNLMDENKKLKQVIQQLQRKITNDSSSYYSDSSV